MFGIVTNGGFILIAELEVDLLQRRPRVYVSTVVGSHVFGIDDEREEFVKFLTAFFERWRQQANEGAIQVKDICEQVVSNENRSPALQR